MKGYLNQNQIEYILFHLGFSIEINTQIRSKLVFAKNIAELENHTNKIIFLLSDKEFKYSAVKTIDQIPVLFPLTTSDTTFYFENNNLIFSYDILKSAFYLLSGYQEYFSKEKDIYGRYKHTKSIQCILNITQKPIVNYYFQLIRNGLEKFCINQNIEFKTKKLFDNFGFILTHDVDRVDAYSFENITYTFMQLLGVKKPVYSKLVTFKVFLVSLYNYINVFSRKNPFWTFEFLREVERKNNFISVFYFLKNEGKLDARYSIKEKRIKNLIKSLLAEGCEIGIHGSMDSAKNEQSMQSAINELEEVAREKIIGCRQHFLQYHLPVTALIHEKCNIQYDTTLGFAEYEGFKNSYCLPFKLYDFEEDRMLQVWEFPLNVMDVTILGYRMLTFENAQHKIMELINEIKKFNGVFTLLWHNCRFDEYQYKGITNYYKYLINEIEKEKPQNYTGKELVNHLNNYLS